jgi:hypothetical protein
MNSESKRNRRENGRDDRMKTRLTTKTVKLLRSLPGMERTTETGVREMTETGQAILTTALILPRTKAETVIRWIAKELRAKTKASPAKAAAALAKGTATAIREARETDRRAADLATVTTSARATAADLAETIETIRRSQTEALDRHETTVKQTKELARRLRGAARRLNSR